MIAKLRELWEEAFQEPADFTDLFFTAVFSPDRFHCIQENGVPVSALYWFDCHLDGQKLAYIYAVATLKSHHGKGFARRLMTEAHSILKSQGYAGVILVPAGKDLFGMYEKMGYRTATTVTRIPCEQGDSPVAIREITPEEYTRLRRTYLPEGGVEQDGQCMTFLQGYCRFYAGEDFLLIGEGKEDFFFSQELLGNTRAAPGILRALGFPRGRFRTPGKDSDFAMWLPLQADCPKPAWFGLALD